MFSGIVSGTATVQAVERHNEWLQMSVELLHEQQEDVQIGASISVNGTCLTVSKIHAPLVRFDVIAESLAKTTFATIKTGDKVNIERALRPGQENGGHNVSGHIDGTAEVIAVEMSEGNHVLQFKLPSQLRPYVFNKGFLAVHGVSLTAGNVNRATGEFTVWLIPETLRQTNLGSLQVGSNVNIEVNRETQERVDTIKEQLEQLLTSGAVTPERVEQFKKLLLLEAE